MFTDTYRMGNGVSSGDSSSLHPASRYGTPIRKEFALDFKGYKHLNHGSYGTAPYAIMHAARLAMERIESFPDDSFRRKAPVLYSVLSDYVGSAFGAPKGTVALIENATTDG